MRSHTLKWIMLTLVLVITVVVTIQLFWLNKVYSFEQKQFNTNVVKSVRGLLEDMAIADNAATHLDQLLEHPEPDIYLVKVDSLPPADLLLYYLKFELTDFDVLTDCKVGAYSYKTKRYLYQEYLPTPASGYPGRQISDLSVFPTKSDYILLHFPHRNKYILRQMNFWIASSVVLFLTLIALAIGMFYFYKQKFLSEIQKDFVDNFTHEFKTPLAVMKIASEVLSRNSIREQPERLKKYSEIIGSQTEHLQNQVERLLQYASPKMQELSLEQTPFDVSQMIEQAITKLQPLIEEKKAKVELKLDEKNHTLLADRTHLELAIINLLENSLKYTATYTNPLLIVETGTENSDYYISVKDNGIGIPEKYRKNIFRKFYRIPTGDIHNAKGFGLGLNYVKRIVDAHKGRIKINSLPGIGTEFKILLPIIVNN